MSPTQPFGPHNENCTSGGPGNQNTWYDNSVWIGIDGFSDGTVEQTGTSSDCFYGQTAYYAWYEFYPAESYPVTITIHPGDSITASVTCIAASSPGSPGANCITTISDTTDHQSYTSPQTYVPGALLSSAEWIQESAAYEPLPGILNILALTPVKTVTFTNAEATIGGHKAPISAFGSDVYWLVMVDFNFPFAPITHESFYVKAEPSALNRAGNSFSSNWISSGP